MRGISSKRIQTFQCPLWCKLLYLLLVLFFYPPQISTSGTIPGCGPNDWCVKIQMLHTTPKLKKLGSGYWKLHHLQLEFASSFLFPWFTFIWEKHATNISNLNKASQNKDKIIFEKSLFSSSISNAQLKPQKTEQLLELWLTGKIICYCLSKPQTHQGQHISLCVARQW